MQSILIAGDSLDFLTSVPAYPPSDGWTLKYRLVPRGAGTAIAITATTSGDQYRVQVSPTDSASWVAGDYSWSRWVEKSGARVTIESGQTHVTANPASVAAGTDQRSHPRKVLDAIEAVLERRATLDQEAYTINGRELKRTPIGDLLKLRDTYVAAVRQEEAAARVAQGLGARNKLHVRF